jgi:hypothetical protein
MANRSPSDDPGHASPGALGRLALTNGGASGTFQAAANAFRSGADSRPADVLMIAAHPPAKTGRDPPRRSFVPGLPLRALRPCKGTFSWKETASCT